MLRTVQIILLVTAITLGGSAVSSAFADAWVVDTYTTPNPHTDGESVLVRVKVRWDPLGWSEAVLVDKIHVRISGNNGYSDWTEVNVYPWGPTETWVNLGDYMAPYTYSSINYEIWVMAHYTDYENGEDFWSAENPGFASNSYQAPPPPCGGDTRWTIIQEYMYGGPNYPPVNWVPGCNDFSTSGGTTNFTWAEVNNNWTQGSGHSPYGIFTSFSQLQLTRDNWGAAITVQSGYRCPHGNASTNPQGAPQSRHMWGDAVDLTVPNWDYDTWLSLRDTALEAGFTYWECWGTGSGCTTTHLHVDRR